mgnify:CR=1 FL=1
MALSRVGGIPDVSIDLVRVRAVYEAGCNTPPPHAPSKLSPLQRP